MFVRAHVLEEHNYIIVHLPLWQSLGIIVRLCVRGAGERGGGVAGGGVAGRCTTAEWMEFVQSGEDASILEGQSVGLMIINHYCDGVIELNPLELF